MSAHPAFSRTRTRPRKFILLLLFFFLFEGVKEAQLLGSLPGAEVPVIKLASVGVHVGPPLVGRDLLHHSALELPLPLRLGCEEGVRGGVHWQAEGREVNLCGVPHIAVTPAAWARRGGPNALPEVDAPVAVALRAARAPPPPWSVAIFCPLEFCFVLVACGEATDGVVACLLA